MEEVRELIRRMSETSGQPLDTELFFNPASFNVMWSVVAGGRFSHDDPKLTELQSLLLQYVVPAYQHVPHCSLLLQQVGTILC